MIDWGFWEGRGMIGGVFCWVVENWGVGMMGVKVVWVCISRKCVCLWY